MLRQRCTILVVAALVLAALPAFSAPEPQRIERNGVGLEIRYEPISGVPLHAAEVSPVPTEEARTALDPDACAPAAAGAEAFRTGEFLPIPGVARPADKVAPLDRVNPVPAIGARLETEHSSVAREVADVALAPAGIATLPGRHETGQDALPNLVFYAPTGWDFPIVPSNVKATHTVGPDLNDGDSTYFDFAVANTGTATAQPRFYTYLFSDGSVIAGFYTESLPAGYYTYYDDYGRMMTAGTHLIAGFTDSTGVIAESLENDNRWSHSWSWRLTGGALPNLAPYTPTGWDFPIVPSDVRNTRTVGPDLNDLDTTFVDWAIINDGNATAKPLFYVYLYLDNWPIAGWTCDSLPYMYYLHADDDPEFVPGGTHTLAYVGDSTNTVIESNETDNHYSRAFSWRHDPATLANLTAFLPDGWDFPIVPANVPGTNTVGPDLNDQESTWVDLAFANLGNYTAKPRFYIYLYWEATPVAGWYMDSLEPMTYVPIEDRSFRFPAGSHTLSYVLDSLNAVTETNESDNHYLNTFDWRHIGLPELVAYQPPGWDFPIVPANVRNTNTVGPDLNDGDTTFIDWAIANVGSATAKPAFYIHLYLDNVPFASWYVDSMPPLSYAAIEDYARNIASGTHSLATLVDSFQAVPESLENNNRYAHDFNWRHVLAALPNLTPYQPGGWDFPIVPSNVRGTHTVGPDLNDEDTTFVDFAFANNGRATAQPRFYTYLYSDGIPFAGFFTDSLPAGFYASASDIAEFFSYGDHELGVFVDSSGVIPESSETDNTWFHVFTWSHHSGIAAPNATPTALGLRLGANPVRGFADVSFSLPAPEPVFLAAYDRAGRLVAELAQGMQSAGTHRVRWNASGLAAGVYVLRLETASGRHCVKTVTRL